MVLQPEGAAGGVDSSRYHEDPRHRPVAGARRPGLRAAVRRRRCQQRWALLRVPAAYGAPDPGRGAHAAVTGWVARA
ncbi:hypothetical protein RHCRD62_50092 [Rhodococcus sp. RD6.2]|nr:hypothetical protein RHCRD62_50092 [Rhodococcus sp. RD6.2]